MTDGGKGVAKVVCRCYQREKMMEFQPLAVEAGTARGVKPTNRCINEVGATMLPSRPS